MIGRRGFQIVEPPRASSGSDRIQRSRSPPGSAKHRPQIRRWASGGDRQPRQTKLHPNRLRNGVSRDFTHYLGSRSMQEPCQPS